MQDSFIFGEATSTHFFQVTISTQQLFSNCFWSSFFFRAVAFFWGATFSEQALFCISYFFRIATFQSKRSTEQALLENRNFFRTVTFRNSYLFGGEFVKNKDIYRSATFSKQVLPHTINFSWRATFWKKVIFQKSNIPHYLLLAESYLFRVANFSKDTTFYSSYLFRKATIYNILFQKSYYFTATLIKGVIKEAYNHLVAAKVWEFFVVYQLLLTVAS